MILDWNDLAENEFCDAADYYESRFTGLGDRFIDNAETALARMLEAPEAPAHFEHGCRKIRVKKFPYAIVYRIKGDTLLVIAVMNLHRRPGYWTERL